MNLNPSILERVRKIKMLALDIDGVLTDGGLILGTDGREFKVFDVQDGMGITLARTAGLKTAIITGRTSESVSRRAEELKFDILFQGRKKKVEVLATLSKEYGIEEESLCYMGDDWLDLPLLRQAGLSAAPANAREEIKKEVHIVTRASGGKGAVRELVEILLKGQDRWTDVFNQVINENS